MPEGAFCHKPCTVSGGGKSEISKSLVDAVLPGSFYVRSFEDDMALVEEIVGRDYDARPLLSPDRSLGSVIKLLTPNPAEFTPDYNAWLESIPNYVRALVFVIKRFYRPEWGTDWRSHFSVDIINGAPGHELKYEGRRLIANYLRIGREENGAWRTYKLRQDFIAADKVQMEDDITASVTVPARRLVGLPGEYDGHPSLKLAQNCEFRLFQRPDDAIHPGFDRQTEEDMAGAGLFCSNFQPLTPADAQRIVEDVAVHDAFTPPMRAHVARNATRADGGYSICSAQPRLIGDKPTKNPRYLQVRPDMAHPRDRYVAEMGARLYRRLPLHAPVIFPVISVLSGRRNHRPSEGVRPLCVYGPIHYQELPELFMDYICSLTGSSPSTTGAGSEGALTKGPFNALAATADLNNALVSMLLTGYAGFSSAAGFIGPRYRVDHDISLLIPEIWCRLFPHERDPRRLIEAGHLEPVRDFEFAGKHVLASRLGYRITAKFVHTFFGRVFDNPTAVFTDEILQPETQDLAVYRRRGEQHHRGAAAGRRNVLRGRHGRRCLSTASGAAAHHGVRPVRGQRRPPSRDPGAVHAGGTAGERLVSRATRRQAAPGHRALGAPRPEPERVPGTCGTPRRGRAAGNSGAAGSRASGAGAGERARLPERAHGDDRRGPDPPAGAGAGGAGVAGAGRAGALGADRRRPMSMAPSPTAGWPGCRRRAHVRAG